MKYLALLLALVFIGSAGCSQDPPSVRVGNSRTKKANVQFKLANGNTVNINDVEPGTASEYRDIVEGRCDVKAVIQDEPVSPETVFDAEEDVNYTVVIQTGNPPTLRVDRRDK